MKKVLCVMAFLGIGAFSSTAAADALYGRCIGKGGNKCQTHNRISTSWNSRTARINSTRGTYRLDFGGKVNHSVTVYCNGRRVGKVFVKGSTYFTVHCR
jgi:hypothetical protein